MATNNNANFYRGDMLDIIFEERNKEYGAYDLRRRYPDFVRRALIGGAILVALAASIPFVMKAVGNMEDEKTIEVVTELGPPPSIDPNTPPPPPPPKVETPPPPTVATQKFVPPVVKKDEEVQNEEPPPSQEDLKDKQVSTKTQEGDPDAEIVVKAPDLGPPTKDVEPPKPKEPEKEEPLLFAEQMPEFPGGAVEMQKYLASNIKYPAVARENQIEGTVALRFLVDKSGRISDIKIVKDIGGGCGAEAVRVVSSMPQWKPGKQNGREVPVTFTLPVRFRLQ